MTSSVPPSNDLAPPTPGAPTPQGQPPKSPLASRPAVWLVVIGVLVLTLWFVGGKESEPEPAPVTVAQPAGTGPGITPGTAQWARSLKGLDKSSDVAARRLDLTQRLLQRQGLGTIADRRKAWEAARLGGGATPTAPHTSGSVPDAGPGG